MEVVVGHTISFYVVHTGRDGSRWEENVWRWALYDKYSIPTISDSAKLDEADLERLSLKGLWLFEGQSDSSYFARLVDSYIHFDFMGHPEVFRLKRCIGCRNWYGSRTSNHSVFLAFSLDLPRYINDKLFKSTIAFS